LIFILGWDEFEECKQRKMTREEWEDMDKALGEASSSSSSCRRRLQPSMRPKEIIYESELLALD
jgi:hypothetical protein